MKKKVSTIWTEEAMLNLGAVLPKSFAACIDGKRGPSQPEYRPVWRELTPGERTFLLVFWGAFERHQILNLVALYGGSYQKALEVRKKLKTDYEGVRANLTTVTPAQKAKDARERDRLRKKRGTPEDTPFRHHGWMRDDVASEALNRDLEPLLGPSRYDPIRIPEYTPKPSPVRQVSIEEYEATKRAPKYGGVKLAHNKEPIFWAKEISRPSDKINEGFESPKEEKDMLLSANDCDFRVVQAGGTFTIQVEYRQHWIKAGWHNSFPGFATEADAKAALKAVKRYAKDLDEWDRCYRHGKEPALDSRIHKLYIYPPEEGVDEESEGGDYEEAPNREMAGYDDPKAEHLYDPRYSPE